MSVSQQPCAGVTTPTHTLREEMKPREVPWLARGHTASGSGEGAADQTLWGGRAHISAPLEEWLGAPAETLTSRHMGGGPRTLKT